MSIKYYKKLLTFKTLPWEKACVLRAMPRHLYTHNTTGLPHYKQKSRIFGSQSRLRDSKPRNNALHAFCGIETIELPLRSSHKKSVFESRPAPSHQHYGKAFIMRKPRNLLLYINCINYPIRIYLSSCLSLVLLSP